MAIEVKHALRPGSLAKVLSAHREEATRLRKELGDPEEALSAFVRSTFDRDALESAYQDLWEGGSFWAEDDDAPDGR
jgi:hypothetical protein